MISEAGVFPRATCTNREEHGWCRAHGYFSSPGNRFYNSVGGCNRIRQTGKSSRFGVIESSWKSQNGSLEKSGPLFCHQFYRQDYRKSKSRFSLKKRWKRGITVYRPRHGYSKRSSWYPIICYHLKTVHTSIEDCWGDHTFFHHQTKPICIAS